LLDLAQITEATHGEIALADRPDVGDEVGERLFGVL
jgi:hypothetical protein